MIDKYSIKLLIGTDYPILEKIRCAERLFNVYGRELLSDKAIMSLLEIYRQTIQQSWIQMKSTGVIAECTDCAANDGGSCCGKGVEDHFDVALLLINLLMGCRFPSEPWDETGCWFLGKRGCGISARHVICVNYICKRLYSKLEKSGLRLLQEKIVLETDAGFALEESIKKWLRNKGL
ncbi:MAG: hypothetical protein JRF20_07620 [Deltaproteobacteria bacterium]|nr:hypothetical protein [Deltaproteobacteria bacterium]MBW1932591.1 hypothetical protein [Deltaproteobacteria bacterium]MBW1937719.1 hypothetical protein [Deltaproteobacteria bacterium]MBW1964701.1 hypothetical protein [Deltaproteobacteria bacterium]MBW2079842.1 hypothetical protein [Deltaproteobacteria bacterium]